ncbi:MAG: 2Fe-2S iron-sulfur cluster-binding protein [Porticoccaceae bacterium]|nr:2Fe-2S iron-sulfur cluster binding domain-containing protein [Pseudomonadales bacterium]MCP5171188.1 2Fe-2S iron-sulfur cluster binding domain-containing protein [Pseudomonadales bacterium]MCP5301574.1 2Fe-2S iron-sulfur cluster binding domain-containing protein [Pseudomonadales bacterium]
MPLVNFYDHEGNHFEVNVETGTSVMQAAIDNGIDGILAECGGACSCATCHCYIDSAWTEKAGAPSEIEQQMLECAVDPQENSRLACQVTVTEEMDGVVINLPESQY